MHQTSRLWRTHADKCGTGKPILDGAVDSAVVQFALAAHLSAREVAPDHVR
jgi:hypothetical protein